MAQVYGACDRCPSWISSPRLGRLAASNRLTRISMSNWTSDNCRAAPRAPAHLQVRRLSLLLTGLPPDLARVNSFVDNPTDEQYARIVDYYLKSPHFGERWARHWMDVVRYAETYGYEWNFLVRDAWRYRDYLIRAFNHDLPYDQLIREHIAGDLLDEPRLNQSLGINESTIGTGVLSVRGNGP